MEFRQLNTFVTAAQTKSFSRAAQILGYSQSAVTVQIKLLEEELGVKLFDRLGKKISLTGEGQKLLKQSRQILKEVSRAKETAGQEGELCSPLHIGTVGSLCSAKLPAVLNYNYFSRRIQPFFQKWAYSSYRHAFPSNSICKNLFLNPLCSIFHFV